MKAPTSRTLSALLLAAGLLLPATGLAQGDVAPAVDLVPAALDAGQVGQQLFAFDLLVAGAEQAAQQDAAASRQLAHNGLHVAERPMGLTAAQAGLIWRAVGHLPRQEKRAALALLQQSDVVTTEAHALLLEMVGPAPTFAPHAPPAGLGPRQLAWVRLAPEISQLLQAVWRDAQVAGLYRQLAPSLNALQPSERELVDHNRLLDETFGQKGSPAEQVRVLVVPLMAQDTGATLMLGRHGALTLVAPAQTAAERNTLVLHEMLHPRIANLIAQHPQLAQAIGQAACLRGALKDNTPGVAVSQVYDGWNDYFAESWVRGLSHRLSHSPEDNDGFVLAAALGRLGSQRPGADTLAEQAQAMLGALTQRLCHG